MYGGPEEIRTPDPYNANVMRSQLRYRPKSGRGDGNHYMPLHWVCQGFCRTENEENFEKFPFFFAGNVV